MRPMYSTIGLRLCHRILAHDSRRTSVVLGFFAALILLQGCQLFGGARIDELAIGTGKPSNVAAFVSVTRKGKPVVGLPASAFQLEENSQPINAETSEPASTNRNTLSTKNKTSFFSSSRKYSAVASAENGTRKRTPGWSDIWPKNNTVLSKVPLPFISR